jgi:general secretion pathway protein D
MSSSTRKNRSALLLAVVITLLIEGTVPAYGGDGKKYFKQGVEFAENKQWDKAAERLALAVAEEPANVEYQLHLQRALVNAAVLLVERGDRLAAQKDYNAAYNAYRQAYAFDVTNEVAAMKMRRMQEAQGIPLAKPPVAATSATTTDNAASVAVAVTAANGKGANRASADQAATRPAARPARTDVIIHNGSLLGIIEQIAQTIHLNVAFDQQVEAMMKSKTFSIELRDVTASEALEIILQINNLMYVQVGLRTIVITMDTPANRARYEPMAVRTFFIKNADLNDLRAAVASTVGSKQIVASKQLNALVVRDSRANLELIEAMIASLDKSKAEVLIDINLYEVSKNDLLQLGNQLTGTSSKGISLSNLGGINQQSSVLGAAARTLTGPFGFALGMPASTLSIFQDKGKARLLASTQVHVLDNEQHQIRIGQRVPVKTGASAVVALGSTTGTTATSNGLSAIDSIQYENVGLNIDMQPQVFEDEVQVKMKIESSSVDRSTGDLTPSFNQRTMSSVARIKDGQTTMIAGVSRTEDSRQAKGLPLIGLIPILGRFFTTPATNNQQSDVVITVTPHILRRADITSSDHLAIDAGRGADASRQLTIQQIITLANEVERQQNLIADAGAEKHTADQPPAGQRSSTALAMQMPIATAASGVVKPAALITNLNATATASGAGPQIERRQVDRPGAQTPKATEADGDDDDDDDTASADNASGPVRVSVRCSAPVATSGQDFYVAINLLGEARISSSLIALDYDPNLFEVKRVADSGLLRAAPEFSTAGGRLTVRLERSAAGSVVARGQLLLIVMRAKAAGESSLTLSGETSLYNANGQAVSIKLQGATVEVR